MLLTGATVPVPGVPTEVERLRTIVPVTSSTTAARVRDGLPQWSIAVLAFLAVRAIGLAVLALFAARHDQPFSTVLTKWDGQWLLAIAEHGYGGVPNTLTDANGIHTAETAYAFFPGYSMLVSAVASVPGVSVVWAAIVLNTVLGAVAAVAVARIG